MNTSEITRLIEKTCKIKKSKGRFFCEICGEKLADLASCCSADEIFRVSLIEDGSMQREQVDAIYASEGDEMLCPYCRETIGHRSEDAARHVLSTNAK